MATSAIKIESNRANSQLSTGPRTEQGRQTSSQNAATHHLTGGSTFIEGENREEYEQHCAKYFRQFKPMAEHEIHFTTEVADSTWRMKRARRMENELLEKTMNPYTADDDKDAIQ